ncbi:MAG: NAD(P)H-dependent oxidoreductase [Oscillospiraceae bacterium]|nr:NAD(P)H-dependent oxidoreductase [Oscillospiraceae bacterium]
MKIVVIHGSMRKGNTYALTGKVTCRLSAMPDTSLQEFGVADLDLPFCRSCHQCFTKGEQHCPHYETIHDIYAALVECDGIIVAGTTYMWAVNAALKNLLDHFAYMFHRPVLFGKKGMVITTSAGAGEKKAASYLKTILGQWGVNGALVVTQNEKERSLQSDVRLNAKIERFSNRFYALIKSKQQIAPGFKSIAVHNAFRAMSLSGFTGSEADGQFWQKEGFRDRAYPVKAGTTKYLFGVLVFSAVRSLTGIIGKIYIKRNGSINNLC